MLVFWFLQFLIFLAFLLAFLQAFGFLKIKKSRLEKPWFYSALLYFLFIEFFIFLSSVSRANKTVLLGIICFYLWMNFLKFTLGFVQERELCFFNRFEHFLAGLVLFYGFFLISFAQFFSIRFGSAWTEAFFYFLLTNLAAVIHETVELFLDKVFKAKLLVGPGVYDTNVDLLMTFLGGLTAFLIQVGIC